MKKQLLSAVVLCALGAVGCGEDPITPPPTDTGPKYNTEDKVRTALEGKTLVMEGNNIPTHPNGINQNLLFDPSTQCYNKVSITVGGGNFNVTSVRAVVEGATTNGTFGTCNHANVRDTVSFNSIGFSVANVKTDGTCFDITVPYNGFTQEGRGQISQDGKTLQLELFFQGALGHRCADGGLGGKPIKYNGADFTGNAIQTYVIQ